MRWPTRYRLADEKGERPAWQITRGKRSQDHRQIWDLNRRQYRKTGKVAGCQDCLELVAEDLQDPDTHYGGYCLHCRREITATGSVEWRRVVRRPCPHCGRAGW